MANKISLIFLIFTSKLCTTISKTTNKDFNQQVPVIEALSPVGIRVSIDHIDGMEFFSFHGKINSPIGRHESGILSKDVTYPINGRWTFEDHSVQLKVGDIVNYWIFLQINQMGHRIDNLSSVIKGMYCGNR